ncbi:MAG: hypothetical protein P8X39_00970 [Desulfofustis sp.]
MASSPRRIISSFSLSFLDIMFCGFGAVVLLVLIINTNTLNRRDSEIAAIRSEQTQQEMEQRLWIDHLERQQAELSELEAGLTALQKTRNTILAELGRIQGAEISAKQRQSLEQQIQTAQAELQALEAELRRTAEQKTRERRAGRQIRTFVGTGNRQYLTGLKLDGERILILVDASASMLDTTVVDVVRRKVLDETSRRSAPKWLRTVSTVEWLVANLPPDSTVQIHHFNTEVTPLAVGAGARWTPVNRFEDIDAMIEQLKGVAPIGGTNFEAPFLRARSLTPPPDNIVLLTDGLPTQDNRGARSSTISAEGRVKLYLRAIQNLPGRVPVNTILFPMEGDPLAASYFWKLAVDSGGSFFTPSRDWP